MVAMTLLPAKAALVLHLNFENNVSDQSGNGNNGSLLGSTSYIGNTPSGSGLAIQSNGTDAGTQVASHATINTSVFTLSYWINPNEATQSGPYERLTSREGDSFETALNASNQLAYYSPATSWITIPAATVGASSWTHVVWRNANTSGTGMELFINGSSVYTGQGVTLGASPGFMNIGTRHNNTEGYEGLLDEFRLYDSTLTNGEISGLASIPEPSVTALLLAGLTWLGLRRR